MKVSRVQQIADWMEAIAAQATYDEAIAGAKGDPDAEAEIREEYRADAENDLSDIIRGARNLLA